MTKTRTARGALSIATLAIVFAIGTALTIDHVIHEEEEYAQRYRTGAWAIVQAQVEQSRFAGALDRYALGDASTDHAALMERYDILWSRFPLILESEEGASARTIAGVVEGTETAFAVLQRMEARLDGLRRSDLGTFATLRHDLDAIQDAYQPVIQASIIDIEGYRKVVGASAGAHVDLFLYIALTALSGVGVIGFLAIEHRAAARLLVAAEESRREAATLRADFIAAIGSVKDGFALYDKDDRLILFNDQYKHFYPTVAHLIEPGASFETLMRAHAESGRPVGEFEDDEQYIAARLARHRNPSGTHEYELADGRVIELRENKTPDGGIVSLRTDITERKRAERERANLLDQFHQAQKMEAIGTLAGGIAHDFNNILTSILGNASLAQFDLAKDHPAQEQLIEVIAAGRRAQRLVQQILMVSRAHERELEAVRLDLVTKETLRMLRATMPATIALDLRQRADQPTVLSDATQLHQVVMNLCVNAGHAVSENGGTVRIELDDADVDGATASLIREGTSQDAPTPIRLATEADGTARLWIGCLKAGPHVKLAVSDDGRGMDSRTLARIFDPFFTTKDIGKGTGLGLVAVQGIVLAAGGAIAVTTAPGRGSIFKILLPRAAAEAPAEVEATKTLHPGTGSILFVDDEPSLVRIGKRTLERAGYRVVGFTDSVAALDAFVAEPARWDLVITDQTMPAQTGMEMSRAMLTLRPDVPIILCTGFADMVDDAAAHAVGIRAFVMKPIVGPDLTELVQQTLRGASDTKAA